MERPHMASRFCRARSCSPPREERCASHSGRRAWSASPRVRKPLSPSTHSATVETYEPPCGSSGRQKRVLSSGTNCIFLSSTAPWTKSVCPRSTAADASSRYWRTSPPGITLANVSATTSSSPTSLVLRSESSASSVRQNSNVSGQPSVCLYIQRSRSARQSSSLAMVPLSAARASRYSASDGTFASQCGRGISVNGRERSASSSSELIRSLFRSRLPARKNTRSGAECLSATSRRSSRRLPGPRSIASPPKTK
mmetsp:Transcript_22114/g.47718  ORF Transcript_22114/g.47718 Transcript_22114/m.47718 type:complete len:254 (-) Transcript_22114:451-1212(-)